MATKILEGAQRVTSEKNAIETWLDERFVKYTYFPERSITDIDEAKSVQNQARFQALIPDLIARYKEAIRKGAVFPAIVVFQLDNGKLVIIDGNHRYKATRDSRKHKTMPMYVLHEDTEPEMIQVLTYEANPRLNGQPPSDEERLQHGVWLMNNGATQTVAAQIVGVTTNALSKASLIAKADNRAYALNLNKWWNKLRPDARVYVNQVPNDEPFVEAVKFMADGSLTAGEYKELVVGIKNLRSEKDQLQFIKDQHEALRSAVQQRGGGVLKRGVKSPRHGMMMHLGFILAQNHDEIVNACVDDAQKEALSEKCYEAMIILDDLTNRLAK